MANGFTNVNVNKLIESGRNWNLANDVELLKCLEKFSENIINNASLTLSSMDNLEDSLNETFLKVRTVANKFQAIADNQFIENRVQEEEDFVITNNKNTETVECEISSETSKSQLLESIKDCQNALRKKFETVQLSGIDSEDDMANSSPVVLVPKDIYKERRLPHLIGGEQFIADETLGLITSGDFEDPNEIKDDDNDETDVSSYHSATATKNRFDQIDQVISILTTEKETLVKKDLFLKEKTPSKTSLEEHSEKSQPSALANSTISDSSNDNIEVSNSCSFEEKSDYSAPAKTEEEVAPQNSFGASRDQLLSGHKFASFKEDLARVLSNVKPYRKQSTSDSDGSKSDISSPNRKGIGNTFNRDENSPPQIQNHAPSPAISDEVISPCVGESSSGNNTKVDNSSSITLPSVSSNVLEHLSKGRAKVSSRRRPPSRKHRQFNVEGNSLNDSSQDPNMIPSDSTRSEDASIHESTSTQPGSNILSPATDEEDLFVLPAFDLPTDPPSRGLFFGDSLLSPGTAIDDGGLSTSPLFPTKPVTNQEPRDSVVSPKISRGPELLSSPHLPDKSEQLHTKETKEHQESQTGLFPDHIPSLKVESEPKPMARKVIDAFKVNPDLFSESSSNKDSITEKHDIFAPESDANTFSSSPPLFADWSQPSDSIKTNRKSSSKSSFRSGLQWDLLGSDDLSEDLFRPQKKESPSMSTTSKANTSNDTSRTRMDKNNIFSPSLSFEKSTDGIFFEDETTSATKDLFSDSSSFIGLSLPKSKKDSLFADDEDDDDDSLFKSSPKPVVSSLYETNSKARGSSIGDSNNAPKKASSREAVYDPLSSLNQLE